MAVDTIPADYDATIGQMHRLVRQGAANAAGDPGRAAEILVRTVKSGAVPSHLPLGVNAVEMSLAYSRQQIEQATAWEAVSRSADFGQPYPAELPV
jgi:hypothetical protein